jgi:copper(I)-binding protein
MTEFCPQARPGLRASLFSGLFSGLCAVFFATSASAVLLVNLPWLRVAPDARSAEVFMAVTSTDGATLVGASSLAAKSVTLVAPGRKNQTVAEIVLPAKVAVQLAPGGYRIVFTRLTRPLKRGDHVPITLTIQSEDGTRQTLAINAEVRRRSALEDEMQPHKH